jgi:catechol 2,3-dioxygenase-like lactoylglutathione lyase family enzyme
MGLMVEGLVPLIQVFDMPRSIAFYRDLLGFEVVQTSPPLGPDHFDWAMLRLGGARLMLNTAYDEGARPAEPEAARVMAHRDTGLFFGCPDIDAAYSHLLAKGTRLRPPSTAPYGMRQLFLSDPDGYELCFQWPAAPAASLDPQPPRT